MNRIALRAGRSVLPGVLGSIALAACGDSGGGGGGPVPSTYWVFIDPVSASVTSTDVELSGDASCDACPPSEVGFGSCPPVQGPFSSGIEVLWSNLTSGEEGSALHAISGHCACLFSTCWTSYRHGWLATVPLVMGPNVIEVAAFGPESGPGSDTITITRAPPPPVGVEAHAGAGQIELYWDPVALGDSYTVLWSETSDVSPLTAHRVEGATSPFRHLGLADDVTIHYAVSTVSSGQEGPLSSVVWATAGWRTEVLPVPAAATVYADTAIATDALDHVHVHLSRQAPTGTAEQNDYVTDGSGSWIPSPVAVTSWRSAGLALDSPGTAHLAYLRPEGVVHAWGTPGAWSTEVVDALGTCEARLALDALARVHVAYRAATVPPELRHAWMPAGTWAVERVDGAELGCNSGVATLSLALEGDGTPHLAYGGPSPGQVLQHATRQGELWVRETIHAGPVQRSSLALASDGTPHVVFADEQGELKHARRAAPGDWEIERVPGETWLDTPSLALDADGNVHLGAFAPARGGALCYATNAGGAWRLVRVTPATYSDTALAVDFRGWVHIATFDGDETLYSTRR
jgi:hypothetical protein